MLVEKFHAAAEVAALVALGNMHTSPGLSGQDRYVKQIIVTGTQPWLSTTSGATVEKSAFFTLSQTVSAEQQNCTLRLPRETQASLSETASLKQLHKGCCANKVELVRIKTNALKQSTTQRRVDKRST